MGTNSQRDGLALDDTGLPTSWDREADIVIIGYGGSGATMGAVAAQAGADVLILEKGEAGGGNSVCVAGSLILDSTDDEASLEYLDWMCGGQTDREVLEAYVNTLREIPSFQQQLGFEVKDNPQPFRADGFYPEWPGAPGAGGLLGNSVIRAPGGAALYNAIAALAEKHGVQVETRTPAVRLVQHPRTREVLGVIARNPEGQEIAVKGRKATVLACGGFEFNEAMRQQYLTHVPTLFVGSPNLTGDGITMASEVGAQLWHMNSTAGPLYWGIKVDNDWVYCTYEFMRLAKFGYSAPFFKDAGSAIWVNKHGRRFHNETLEIGGARHGYRYREAWLGVDVDKAECPNIPAFQIFDQKAFQAGPAMTTLNSRTPAWSDDNQAELEKGWIIKADTIEELAAKCEHPTWPGVNLGGSIDAATLVDTVQRYNQACAEGNDPEFGRDDFLVPLDTPPFYAVGPMVPTFVNTHGGPKHDAQQRVLDGHDEPIGRLYAVGECGSMWGPYYNSMGDISELMTSGILAGRHAVAQTAWDADGGSNDSGGQP